MEFSKEVLEKAQTQAWPDWSGYDLNKSNDSLDLMKAGGKKDLSKLVPVQKQITRNGKTVTQTVWVKPDSDEAKEAQGGKPAPKKEGKSGNLSPLQANAKKNFDKASKSELVNKVVDADTLNNMKLVSEVMKVMESGSANSYQSAVDNILESEFLQGLKGGDIGDLEMDMEDFSESSDDSELLTSVVKKIENDLLADIETVAEDNDLSDDEEEELEDLLEEFNIAAFELGLAKKG